MSENPLSSPPNSASPTPTLSPQAPQLTPEQKKQLDFITGVSGTVKKAIDLVENPADQEARSTFGYKPSAQEQAQRSLFLSLIEKIWWALALVVVVGIVIWYWPVLSTAYCLATNCAVETETEIPTQVGTPLPTVIESIFQGTASQVETDFGWLRPQFFSSIFYYQAGEVIAGNYQGAKRYLVAAMRRPEYGQAFKIYELWRLADGSVVLSGGRPNVRIWLENLEDYYLRQLFSDQVRFQAQFEDDFPQTIAINSTSRLYRREFLTDLGPYDGARVGEPRLELSLTPGEYHQLDPLDARNYKDLKFYTKSYNKEELLSQVASVSGAVNLNTLDQYLFGGSKVVVVDPTGLAVVYELVFVDQWNNYVRTYLNRDLQNIDRYSQELIKYTATSDFSDYKARLFAGEIGERPAGEPAIPVIEYGLPGFVFMDSQFTFRGEDTRYLHFITGYTSVCQRLLDGKVLQNVGLGDLIEIGRVSIPQVPIYRLADVNHPLNQLAFAYKVAEQTLGDQLYRTNNFDLLVAMRGYTRMQINNIKSGRLPLELPDAQIYIQSNPLLIMLDPWERPVLIWEDELEFDSSCATIDPSDQEVERVLAY